MKFEKLRHRKNGDKEVEHPKPIIEMMSNSREAIEGYVQTMKGELSWEQVALLFIFNELRCIHWHYDNALVKELEASGKE